MARGANLTFWVENPKTVVLYARAAGDVFASSDEKQQAEFLVGLSNAVNGWEPGQSWPMQCRAIAESMTSEECVAVRLVLETLVEHLEAIPTERHAAAVTQQVVDIAKSVVDECRS